MNEDGTVEKLCEKYAEYGLSYDELDPQIASR